MNASTSLGINNKNACTTKIQTMVLIDSPFLLIENYNFFLSFFFSFVYAERYHLFKII